MKVHTEASVDSMSLAPERLVSRLPRLDSCVSLIVVPFGLNGCSSFSLYSFPQPTGKQAETDRRIMMKKEVRVQKLIQAQRLLFQQVDIQFYVTKQNYESVPRARTMAMYYIGAEDISRFTVSIIIVS